MVNLPDSFPITVVRWSEVIDWCSTIRCELRDDNYSVDTVVAIARGGWVPARILTDMLGVTETISLNIEKHTGPERADEGVRLRDSGDLKSLSGRNVLIVDDSVDTGDTMRTALDCVAENEPDSCRAAACHRYASTIFGDTADPTLVDYTGDVVESWQLFLYPWSYSEVMTDAVNGVLVKSGAQRVTENDVYGLLNEYHGIERTELERIHSDRLPELLAEMAREGILAPVENKGEDDSEMWRLREVGIQRYAERTGGE